MPEFPDIPRPEKIRVYKSVTPWAHFPCWRWDHVCRWRGMSRVNSYPYRSWRTAFNAACEHLKDCS